MNGLEALESVSQMVNTGLDYTYKDKEREVAIIEKELKALEIIKKKEVDINSFGVYLSVGWDYNLFEKYCGDNSPYEEHPPYQHSMTKDEFDLLKEVLE